MERKEEAAASLLRDGMVWMDLEMTGLNVKTDRIMEVACIVTDAQLNVVAEAPEVVIHLSDEELEGMNDWCKEHHGASGLTQACRESRVTLQEAEEMMLSFVQKYTAYHTAVLAGNSIHMDKVFLAEYMPRLLDHLHYRIVDVSSLKELCKRWYPNIYDRRIEKKLKHRALEDIKESIQELQFYRANLFIPNDEERKQPQ